MASSDARIHFLLVLSCTSYLASPAAAISYGEIIPDEPRNTCVVLINGTCQDLTCQDMGTMSRPLGVASAIFCCSKRGLPHGPDARSLGIHLTRQLFLGSNETCSGTTHSCSPILRRFQEEPIVLFDQNCSADLLGLDFFSRLDPPSYRGTQRRRIVPRGSTRRLLDGATAGAHGRRGPRNQQHVATHRQLASPPRMEQQQLLQASVLGAAVAVAGAALLWLILICAVAGLVLCCIRTKRRRRSTAAAAIELEPEDVDDEPLLAEPQQPQPHQVLHRELGPRQFRYRELAAATGNFAEERRIGRGGFGPVYRGYLKDQDRHVAIKVLSPEQSVQGRKEFLAEVTVISRLRHRNVVQLVGWCDGRRGLALVYELVPGGSLDTHLYHLNTQLAWPQRYNIALGLGSALLYLHTGCDQCVVHGDIKPANVMLDTSRNAKLGDFGLARLTDHGSEPRTTRVVAGTVGYIDPELVNSRRPSTEADVYSFGVVLLEIACGRRPTTTSSGPPPDHQVSSPAPPLLASVRDTYNRGLTLLDAADPRLHGEFNDLQMERLILTGLWCAHHDPARRPSIGQAMGVLRSEDAELPVLPALATSGSGQIRSLEGRAYGDLSAQSSASAYASTGTEYLTSAHTLLEEITYASPSTM